MYDKLVTEVNIIDTSGFVLKRKYNAEKSELENETFHTGGFVKKTDYNAKISEIDEKISSISSLPTTFGLTAVENKIRSISTLVKKTDYNTKLIEIETKLTDHNHGQYITTPEFINLTAGVFTTILAQANLVARQNLILNWEALIKKIAQIKQNIYWLKMN